MRKLVMLLVLVAFVGSVAGLVWAQDQKPNDVTFKGTIVKVVEKVVTLKVTREDKSREMKITTDDKTAVTIDGKDAKVADLKEGMTAEVTRPRVDGAAATKIVATTAATSAPATPAK